MKTLAKIEKIKSLSELIHSRFFDSFQGDKLGNSLFLSDPERAERIQTAAESGADGSTHAEHLEDWREANGISEREIYRPMFEAMGFSDFVSIGLAAALRDEISAEIDDCEKFHIERGTIDNQCG